MTTLRCRAPAPGSTPRLQALAMLVLLAGSATTGCERGAGLPAEKPAPEPVARAGHQLPRASAAAATASGLPSTPTAGVVTSASTRDPGGSAILRAVRVGRHAGAERIVFEFEGRGLPAWKLEYVDRPVRDCGSGDPVAVAGDGWLEVAFTGAQAHTESGEGTSGPRRRSIGQPVVLELVRTCDFEGHVTWVAGLSSPNRFTVTTLADPARLVVDLEH